jgi:hypothetical protein
VKDGTVNLALPTLSPVEGGLSNQMIYMEGRSLDGIVATCDLPTLRATLRPEPLVVHRR